MRLRQLRHPGWTAEWPQSGERVRGHSNNRAILDNWPGGRPSAQVSRFVGAEDRWVVTPSFTVQRVVGSGDFWWATGHVAYPDGSTWFFVVLLELRDQQDSSRNLVHRPAVRGAGLAGTVGRAPRLTLRGCACVGASPPLRPRGEAWREGISWRGRV